MRPHAIARTNPITSRPTRVRSGRSAHGPETAGASYGRRLRGWRVVLTLLFGSLLASACSGAMLTSVANAASAAQIAITADNPPPPAAPTGQASTYTINFTCSAVVGSSCGANPTITIPLDETSSNPATPPIGTWSYSSSSTISSTLTQTPATSNKADLETQARLLECIEARDGEAAEAVAREFLTRVDKQLRKLHDVDRVIEVLK